MSDIYVVIQVNGIIVNQKKIDRFRYDVYIYGVYKSIISHLLIAVEWGRVDCLSSSHTELHLEKLPTLSWLNKWSDDKYSLV